MSMRVGLKGAFGQKQITLADSATVAELLVAIADTTEIPEFEVKEGFPPRIIDFTKIDPTSQLREAGLNLNGTRLQIDTKQSISGASTPSSITGGGPSVRTASPRAQPPNATRVGQTSQTASAGAKDRTAPSFAGRSTRSNPTTSKDTGLVPIKKDASKIEKDPPELSIRTPPNDSYLIHRVMPDDNSCLFRAIGKCVLGNDLDSMTELRSIVAQAIQRDKDQYNEVVLEKEPDEYCKWIQNPDSWGGAIEIGIIAETFDIEVCAVNVADGSIQRFNEGQGKMRSYLVYSGIHWDAIVENAAGKWGPVDIDVAQFDPFDAEVEQKAREIGLMLKDAGYYTDTNKFGIKCNLCDWMGEGQNSAIQHVKDTGHQDFGQVE
jgi:ubiquitin thioesterase OTU1